MKEIKSGIIQSIHSTYRSPEGDLIEVSHPTKVSFKIGELFDCAPIRIVEKSLELKEGEPCKLHYRKCGVLDEMILVKVTKE